MRQPDVSYRAANLSESDNAGQMTDVYVRSSGAHHCGTCRSKCAREETSNLYCLDVLRAEGLGSEYSRSRARNGDLYEQRDHEVHQSEADDRYNIQRLPTEFFAERRSDKRNHSKPQAVQPKPYRSLELSTVEVPHHRWPSKIIRGCCGS